MLFKETFDKHDKTVGKAVDKLFELAFKNQTHEQDMLLIILNGGYYEELVNSPLLVSPYGIGPGLEGWAEASQNQFFDFYQIQQEDRLQFLTDLKTDPKLKYEEEISIHLELGVYLKYWETDRVAHRLYQLTQLVLGQPYNWHFKIKKHEHGGTGLERSEIIRIHVRDALKKTCKSFADVITSCYRSQLRNASGHSQYFLLSRNIEFLNYVKGSKDNPLPNLKFEDWEQYIHVMLLLYRHMKRNFSKYHQKYIEEAKDKHYGLQIRGLKADKTEHMVFYKYELEAHRWTSYESYKASKKR